MRESALCADGRVGVLTKDQYKELVELMELPKGMTTGEVLEMLEGSPPARDMPDQPSCTTKAPLPQGLRSPTLSYTPELSSG